MKTKPAPTNHYGWQSIKLKCLLLKNQIEIHTFTKIEYFIYTKYIIFTKSHIDSLYVRMLLAFNIQIYQTCLFFSFPYL